MKILAIESSCDETAAAIIEDGRKILSNIIFSQAELHSLYGGVVPEIASRKHIEVVNNVCIEALDSCKLTKNDVDAIAATCAPGLIGALLVGANFAKALAFALCKPFIPVHHIRGHIAANYLAFSYLKPPFLCLVVSGGHSLIVHVSGYTDMEILGSTRDDAAGETFDKVARVLGIGYPGGRLIDELSDGGEDTYKLPRASIRDYPMDFSFSGLKTSVINLVHNSNQKGVEINKNDLAMSFCRAISDILVSRCELCLKKTNIKTLVCAGGVAANSVLRRDLTSLCDHIGVNLYLPPLNLCSDNAAMIGSQAYYEFLQDNTAGTSQNAFATVEIHQNISKM